MAEDNGFANILDFGADPTGVRDSMPALVGALNASDDILIPSGSFRLKSSVIVPNGRSLHFRGRASLSIDHDESLIIRGVVHAPRRRLFYGEGSVTGIRHVLPEWFGAQGNGLHDDTDALQASILCVESGQQSDGDGFIVHLGAKPYLITRTLVISPQFRVPTAFVGEGVTGAGTRITAKGVRRAIWVRAYAVGGQPTRFELGGFQLGSADSNTVGVGILIGADETQGAATLSANGLTYAHVHDVLVEQFPVCVRIVNAYGIHFERCTITNHAVVGGVGVETSSQGGANGAGDLLFDACTFSASTHPTSRNVLLQGTTNGVHFRDCTLYGGSLSTQIYARANQGVTDIWFARCSWDAGTVPQPRNYVLFHADGVDALIQDVLFDGCYWRGCSDTHVTLQATNGGDVLDVRFVGGWASDAEGFFLSCSNASGVVVDAMTMQNIGSPNGTLTACYFADTRSFSVTNNHLRLSKGARGGPTCFAYITGASEHFTVVGNMSPPATKEPVTDTTSSSTPKWVHANFR